VFIIKKLRGLFIGVASVILLLTLLVQMMSRSERADSTYNLTIYNWGDYIDPDLLSKFEKETGIHVTYETFDSNEAMFTKVQQGGTQYDIAIPSEYMIDKMKEAKLLERLDHSKIKGLENIQSDFLNLSFDRGNTFSIPYFWGTLGIVYNDQMVKGNPPQHWNDLWDKKYKNNLLLIDGAREVLGLSLDSLGYSINTHNQEELKKASEKLVSLTPNVKAIVADELKMYMAQDEAAVGVTFSGEARAMMDENEHLHYVIPSEGSNLWFDNIVIPKTVKNKDGAYKFINFMLRPENAAQNSEYVGYSTPNKKAQALLPKELLAEKEFYPPESVLKNLEVYQNLGSKMLGIYNELFLQFKIYRK
jgi:spermidine/putrescine transport system substrate-binding protein